MKDAGAAQVVGIDYDARFIRGCTLLKNLYRIEDITFQVLDITTLDGDSTFDVGMMIDFIGKNSILSIRPVYRIDKHLGKDTQGLLRKYPRKYVRERRFYTIGYVIDRFMENWRIELLSSDQIRRVEIKETIHLRRKPKPNERTEKS